MIDLTIHFRGAGQQRQRLEAIPALDTYLFGPGDGRRLWIVSAVVVDATVEAYCIEASPRLTSELQAQWATWGEAIVTPADEVNSE
jgi:hypothetical protein